MALGKPAADQSARISQCNLGWKKLSDAANALIDFSYFPSDGPLDVKNMLT